MRWSSFSLVWCLVGFWNLPAQAQINEYNNKFGTFRAYVDVPSYQVEIKSKVSADNHVIWKPNIRALVGVDFYINGFIGAGIGWAGDDEPGSANRKGVTEYTDYRVGMTLRSFRAEASYQRYSGFYVENSAQIDPSYGGSENRIQDRSMAGGNISASGTFIMSPERFSLTAAIGQDSRQESSGGSWLLGFSASNAFFNTGNGLIPAIVRSRYGEDQNVTELNFYSLAVKGGYGYTVAWSRKWFTTLTIMAGGGAQYRTIKDSTRQVTSGGGVGKADVVFSFGYNGDDFLAAVIATGDMTAYNTQSLELPATLGDAKLAIGAHF